MDIMHSTHIDTYKNDIRVSFFNYKKSILTKVMYVGVFFSLLAAVTDNLGIHPYPWNTIQIVSNYIYIMLMATLIWLLHKDKMSLIYITHLVIFFTFILCCMAFLYMPEDDFRAIWFYILIFITFILLTPFIGYIYTLLSIIFILISHHYLDSSLSELTLNSSILGLIIFSVLFASYTKQLLKYEKELEEKNYNLHLLSTVDSLTGILNKRAFKQISHTLFNENSSYHQSLTLILMDIDHFKNINDSYGHDAGDIALKYFVDIINKEVHQESTFARIGGEEFALLVSNLPLDTIHALTDKIRRDIDKTPIPYKEHTMHMTLSLGISQLTETDISFDDLYKRADKALYQSKNSGRNCSTFI